MVTPSDIAWQNMRPYIDIERRFTSEPAPKI